MIPNIKTPTTEGKFFNIDNRWCERYRFFLPVRVYKEGSEPKSIFVFVKADKDTPRAIREYVFPCLHAHYSEDGIVNVEAVRFAVRAERFHPLSHLTSHYAYIGMLPDVRDAQEGEHFIVPFLCKETGTISPRHNPRPLIEVFADVNTRLYSPEVDRFYSETLPLWEDPFENSWSNICKSISEGWLELDFASDIPSELLRPENDVIPRELLDHVFAGRRNRKMR